MKTQALALCALAVLATQAYAQEITVKDLAEETGLTQRQVQMVLGGRTAFPEYKTGYRFVEKQFKDALGEQRYRDLMAGRKIELRSHKTDAVADNRAPSPAVNTTEASRQTPITP